jgi:hypothetical protein
LGRELQGVTLPSGLGAQQERWALQRLGDRSAGWLDQSSALGSSALGLRPRCLLACLLALQPLASWLRPAAAVRSSGLGELRSGAPQSYPSREAPLSPARANSDREARRPRGAPAPKPLRYRRGAPAAPPSAARRGESRSRPFFPTHAPEPEAATPRPEPEAATPRPEPRARPEPEAKGAGVRGGVSL